MLIWSKMGHGKIVQMWHIRFWSRWSSERSSWWSTWWSWRRTWQERWRVRWRRCDYVRDGVSHWHLHTVADPTLCSISHTNTFYYLGEQLFWRARVVFAASYFIEKHFLIKVATLLLMVVSHWHPDTAEEKELKMVVSGRDRDCKVLFGLVE